MRGGFTRGRGKRAPYEPPGGVLDRVVRQEGHLGRQLELTLRQLERLQVARRTRGPVVAVADEFVADLAAAVGSHGESRGVEARYGGVG